MLAFLGAAGTILQVVEWTLDESYVRKPWVLALLGLGLLVVLFKSLPDERFHFVHAHHQAEIHLGSENLFDAAADCVVVTANRHFDSRIEQVSPESLIAQLEKRWFPDGHGHDLEELIAESTGLDPGTEHPLGTIVDVRHAGERVLLLAMSTRDPDKTSAVLIDDIWTALSALWSYARRHNLASLAAPVLGSGFAKAHVGLNPLLTLLITSYTTAAMEDPICTLRISLPPTGPGPHTLELAQSYCESLGYRNIH